ncbi:MAG: ABC transporter permease [Anaerolineae bacterium]|nr:ABC transporter permease [Anaerolineae bacterium]
MRVLWQALKHQHAAQVGLIILSTLVLAAIFAPILAPYDPSYMSESLLPPSRAHPLGTNDIGQDILSEVLYGARYSLFLGFAASVLSTFLGLGLGLIAGYYERVGFLLLRVVDIFLTIPRFPLIIIMAAFLRPSLGTLVLFFVLFGWARPTRLVRSQVLTERGRAYIEAARVIGCTDRCILLRHLMPSTLPISIVYFVMEFQHVVLAESGLSFLGLGDPTVKSWGAILHYAFMSPTIFISNTSLWWVLPPGIGITLTVLSLALIGLALEEWSNPRLNNAGWTA